MELENLLKFLQESTTGPYSEPVSSIISFHVYVIKSNELWSQIYIYNESATIKEHSCKYQ
jgi:hypothetical protein